MADAWIRERLPLAIDHPEGPTRKDCWGRTVQRDHVPCLVVTRSHPREVVLLQWNLHAQCWDDAEGDDFRCTPDEAICWMAAPAPPAEVPSG